MRLFKSIGLILICFILASTQTSAQDLKPTVSQALIIVALTDYNGIPESEAIVSFKHTSSDKIHSGTTDNEGKYSLLLAQGETFTLICEKYGVEFNFGDKLIPDNNTPYSLSINLKIRMDTVFSMTYLLDIHFETDESTLLSNSYPALESFLDTMKSNPDMVVEIGGHTDDVGSFAYNQTLSAKRANAVKTYFTSNGIHNSRITSKGYGNTQPVANNSTEEGRKQNRRTEVRIISR
ncbi:MAG: OmpA family protein [Bacteroidetes bacterium]|nr:OmpA family protein [Bacteroidota bacterium]